MRTLSLVGAITLAFAILPANARAGVHLSAGDAPAHRAAPSITRIGIGGVINTDFEVVGASLRTHRRGLIA